MTSAESCDFCYNIQLHTESIMFYFMIDSIMFIHYMSSPQDWVIWGGGCAFNSMVLSMPLTYISIDKPSVTMMCRIFSLLDTSESNPIQENEAGLGLAHSTVLNKFELHL